jgi:Rieske Fe-S protein
MADAPRPRRAALRSLILSLLGGAALWRFLTPRAGAGGSRPGLQVKEEDVPPQGALALPEHRVALVRSGDEVFAVDLTCTHLGCTVRATAQGFSCPCHGSRFGRRGEVEKGPAPRPLQRLAVERRDGIIRVARG